MPHETITLTTTDRGDVQTAGWPVGLRITGMRMLTQKEIDALYLMEYSGSTCAVLELEDGSFFYPMSDEEGNGTGVLFGYRDGKDIYVIPHQGE